MSTKQAMLPCKPCDKPTLHLVDKPNHILHLLLSVITAGLWIIIWFFVAASARPTSCTACGKTVKSNTVSGGLGVAIVMGAIALMFFLMYKSAA